MRNHGSWCGYSPGGVPPSFFRDPEGLASWLLSWLTDWLVGWLVAILMVILKVAKFVPSMHRVHLSYSVSPRENA